MIKINLKLSSTLTLKQKISIINNAILELERNEYGYICARLQDGIWDCIRKYPSMNSVMVDYFPELTKYKPRKVFIKKNEIKGQSCVWFNFYNYKPRIKILNKLLIELQTKNKKK